MVDDSLSEVFSSTVSEWGISLLCLYTMIQLNEDLVDHGLWSKYASKLITITALNRFILSWFFCLSVRLSARKAT